MRSRLVALALLGLVVSGRPADAGDPVLMVASFNVHPDKEAQFLDLVKKYDSPMFAKMMAEGAIQAWGVDTTVLHDPAGATHHLWWVAADNAALDKIFAAEDAVMKQMEADDAKAAQSAKAAGKPAPKTAMARILESFEFTKHQDSLYRVAVSDGRPVAAGAKPYFLVTFGKALPGKSGEFRAAWEKYIKPSTAKLLADGAVIGYGLATASPRTGAFTHMAWITIPDLAARDKFYAALDARSAADVKDSNEAFARTLDGDATRGLLLRSLIYETAAPPQK